MRFLSADRDTHLNIHVTTIKNGNLLSFGDGNSGSKLLIAGLLRDLF